MRKLLLISALLVVTTATPNYYREHYEYKEQSLSFKNNELQHKKEEAGKYAKIEDGTSAPIERSAFHKSEYHAPGTEGDSNSQFSSSIHGANAQRYQQQSASTRQWNQGGGSSMHDIGTGSSSTAYQNGRIQSGNHRLVQEPESVPTSYKREWSSHSSYKYGQTLPSHGTGHGLGHRRNNFDSSTSDSQQNINFENMQQKQDETQQIVNHNRGVGLSHSIGQGRGHYEHGRGHGYGHTSHQTYRTNQHQTGLNINHNLDTTNSGTVPQTFEQLPGTGKIIYTNTPISNTDNSFGTQNSGTTRVTQQSTRTSSTYNSGSNVNKALNTDDSKVYTIPQSTNVRLVPGSHTGTSNLRHQTTRAYTISGTDTNSNKQFNTEDTVHPYQPVRFSNSYPKVNTDDSVPQIKVTAVPVRPIQTTGTGKVTHQTVRSYSSTSSNTGKNVPEVKIAAVPVIPSQTSDTGRVSHQTIRTSSTSQSFKTKTDDVGSVPIQTYPTVPIISSQPSETGKFMHQTIRTSSSQNYRPITNIGDDTSVSQVKFTTVPVNPSQTSDAGKVTHHTIRTSSTSQTFKTKTDDVGSMPIQTYPTVPITSQPSDTRQLVHQTIRTSSSQNYRPITNIDDDTSVPQVKFTTVPVIPSQTYDAGKVTHQTIRTSSTSQSFKTKTDDVGSVPILIPVSTSSQNYRPNTNIDDDVPQTTYSVRPVMPSQPLSTGTATHGTRTYISQHRVSGTRTNTQNVDSLINKDNDKATRTLLPTYPNSNVLRNVPISTTTEKIIPVYQQQPELEPEEPKLRNNENLNQNVPYDHQKLQPSRNQETTHQTRNVYQSSGYTRTQDQKQQNLENISQENEDDYDDLSQKNINQFQDITQQTQDGFGKLEFGSQQKQHEFVDSTHYTQTRSTPKPIVDTSITNSQHTSRQTYRTHQRESKVDKTEFPDIPQGSVTSKPLPGQWKIIRFESDDTKPDREINFQDQESEEDLTQQRQSGFRVVKFDSQHTDDKFDTQQREKTEQHRFTEQRQTEYNQPKDLSQKQDNLGINTGNSGYRTSNTYSSSNSYSTQNQQHPHVIYSPIRVDSTGGQLKVFQSMQIPGGATEEMKQKLQEQMRQQLEAKMQELVQQENSQHSSKVTFSPIHVNRQSGTGKLQLYQTLQIPAGASEDTRQRLQEQLRQQLEVKMQELMQQQNSQSFHQTGHQISGPIVHHISGQGGEITNCDDSEYNTGFSSSSSMSSSTGGANHYSMKMRPGSSFTTTRQIQYPTGSYTY